MLILHTKYCRKRIINKHSNPNTKHPILHQFIIVKALSKYRFFLCRFLVRGVSRQEASDGFLFGPFFRVSLWKKTKLWLILILIFLSIGAYGRKCRSVNSSQNSYLKTCGMKNLRKFILIAQILSYGLYLFQKGWRKIVFLVSRSF